MAAKIIAFFLTMLINIVADVAVFFVMLMAMNGYGESDAIYGIVSYIALAVIVTLLMSSAAAILAHILIKLEFGSFVSALIAVIVFSVTGVVLKIVCGLIGIGIAEFVRVNF
ncbi:MAG TPA: hypothetical protein VK612_01065 [Pyrinomonadaceae bacterium]|nr:hypothetical protein [Pyrinomonadaceae bacterium]